MKIKNLKINAYGKLHDVDIDLKNNINIIHGNNESGKSTVLQFIINSCYGTAKNKKGKEISDFDKFKPWEGEDFSGKLRYILDNGEEFEIYREFGKKNPKIFDKNLEDVSKKYSIDKTKGNDFFFEQTKIDEQLFISTSAILQKEVKIEKNMQMTLIQKIANMVGTGEDNVSYKKAIDRLDKKQLNEIGTERSREKPINILEKRILEINKEISNLEEYERVQYGFENDKNQIKDDLIREENKLCLLKEIKAINENKELEKEKIRVQENIRKENSEKIKTTEKKIEKLTKETENKQKEDSKNNKKVNKKIMTSIFLTIILITIVNVLQIVLLKNIKVCALICLLSIMLGSFFIYLMTQKKHKKTIDGNSNNNNEIINLKNEVYLLKNNNDIQEKEIKRLIDNFNINYNSEKEIIKNKYKESIEETEINNLLNSEKVDYLIDSEQKVINDKKIKIQTIEINKKTAEEKLEKKANLEEELSILKEEYEGLKRLNTSINLAKEIIKSSYEKMKETVTPKFTQELSETVAKITNGSYTNVKYNDEVGLIVETKNGNYVPADRLSTGTIDQMYLSLRLAIIKEISEEKIPILLDEAFAYYDEERLSNILKYINEIFEDMQIIIFTCTNREQEILEKLNIDYNLVEL